MFDEASRELISQGVLGAVAVILLVACARLFIMLVGSYKDRLSDNKETLTAINNSTQAMKDATAATQQLSKLIESSNDRAEDFARTHTAALREITDELKELRNASKPTRK